MSKANKDKAERYSDKARPMPADKGMPIFDIDIPIPKVKPPKGIESKPNERHAPSH